MKRTITTQAAGPLAVRVEAQYLELRVIAEEGLLSPTAELEGPEEVTAGVTWQHTGDSVWALRWPRSKGSTVYSRSNVQSARNITITGDIYGAVIAGGNVIINGVQAEQAPPGESICATIRVPANSALGARVADGSVITEGPLACVQAVTTGAALTCTGPVGTLDARSVSGDIRISRTGPAVASSIWGDIRIGEAAGAISASSTSGDVDVHAAGQILVKARSVSGDVRVTAAPGAKPMIGKAQSVSGSVHLPRGC